MSRITVPTRHEKPSMKWKAALPVLGIAAACLAGCAQTPGAQASSSARNSPVSAGSVAAMPLLDFSSCSKPVYPQEAHARRVEGTSTLRFLVDTDGSVVESSVLKSSGDRSLDEAARVAIAKCRFRPAVHVNGGAPQRAWVPVQYVWTLGAKG